MNHAKELLDDEGTNDSVAEAGTITSMPIP